MNSKALLQKQVSQVSKAMAGVSLATLVALPVAAQDQLEEVVVTAQKREQAITDVPMAISVLSADDIRAQGSVSLSELQATVPSLNVLSGAIGELATLRGISPSGSLLPVVGRYVDEMLINAESMGGGIIFPLVDIARVEVLRGPQGTLYGAGSIGGVIKYQTAAPAMNGELNGMFELSGRTVDDGGDGFRTFAAADLPIDSDTFGMRFTGYYEEAPGWIDNSFQGEDANETDSWFGRIKTVWNPTENLGFSLLYQHYDKELAAPNSSDLNYDSTAFTSGPATDEWDLLNLVIEWDMDFASLTSSTGYIDRKTITSVDISGFLYFVELFDPGSTILNPNPTVPNPISKVGYVVDTSNEIFTQEFRLAGSVMNDRLYWTAGAFYQDSEQGGPSLTEYYPDPTASDFVALVGSLHQTTDAWAVFAELTYNFTDKWEGTVGLRYYEDTREANNQVLSLGQPTSIADEVDNDTTVPRFVLKYRYDSDLMVYGSASMGFRSGGIQFFEDPFGTFENTFDPEDLWTYELGAKGFLFDGAVTYDTAVFYTEYDNVQVYAPNNFGLQAFVNGGEAEVTGFEIAATWSATDNLNFRGSYSYNDSEYTEPGLSHDVGDPMDYIPENSYSLSADYQFNWTNSVGGNFRVDYYFTDERPYSAKGFGYVPDTATSDEIESLNLRLGATFGSWNVTAFVENAQNNDAALSKPVASRIDYTLQQPRIYGLMISTSF